MIREFISRHKFATGFLCGLIAFPLLIVSLLFVFIGRHMLFWESYKFTIPETQSQLVFHYRAIHPFLTEYERKVQIISNDRKSPQYWLATNTGGFHHLNLYIAEIENEKWVRIKDEFSECVINLKTLQAYSVERIFGKIFVGSPDERENWAYTWENNDTNTVKVAPDGEKVICDPKFDNLGKFIGALDARTSPLRFVPASEKPEEHIVTQEELFRGAERTVGQ